MFKNLTFLIFATKKMIYLLVSIICSVSVGVLFKLIKTKTSINIFLITINYLVAFILSYLLFQPKITTEIFYHSGFLTMALPLILLMPTVFLLVPKAIENSGIIKTDIAQRISLIIPILCSFWLFGEIVPNLKVFALIIGFLSIFLILSKPDQSKNSLYLILVFFGYGIADVLYKKIALFTAFPYTTMLFYIFGGCMVFSLVLIFSRFKSFKSEYQPKSWLYGILLGSFNFCNIYFYLKAHQAFKETPTTVFAGMNFGVIVLGTLIGYFFFKEKLTKKNVFGLIMAILAVSLIVISDRIYD